METTFTVVFLEYIKAGISAMWNEVAEVWKKKNGKIITVISEETLETFQ